MSTVIRRGAASLRPRRPAAGTPRIAVLGNCQSGAIAAAMRLLLPGAGIDHLSIYRTLREDGRLEVLARRLARYDVVFASRFPAPLAGGGDVGALAALTPLVQIPVLVFGAFHPDVVYVDEVARSGRRHLEGPMGTYHSALALFAHRQGWDARRTLRLFGAEAMRRLGYLDMWDGAAGTLLALGREAGHPLEADLLRWTRRGAFMHLVNHPRGFVTDDVARALLRRAGLPFADLDLDAFLPDSLARRGSWPVYPAVADAYGLPGAETFLRPGLRGRAPRAVGLADFVGESLAAFGPRARPLTCERVDRWCDDPRIVADLSAMTA